MPQPRSVNMFPHVFVYDHIFRGRRKDFSAMDCQTKNNIHIVVMCIGLLNLHCQCIPTSSTENSMSTWKKSLLIDLEDKSTRNDRNNSVFAPADTTAVISPTVTFLSHSGRHRNASIDVILQERSQTKITVKQEARLQLRSPLAHRNPLIPVDIKVARIYESFRTERASDELSKSNKNDDGIHRSKRPYANSTGAAIERTTLKAALANVTAEGALAAKLRKRTASADMLSRNISILLENLLKSYEQSQLPTHGQGIPTVVRTNILIRSMGPVSELDMDYSMDCYFRQYWRDTRLSFQGPIKSLSLSIKMLDKIWRPDTYFYNGKHSHIHTITVPNKLLRLDQDGGILYSMRLTVKATCPMQLKNFPMDRQSCPLILGSYGYTNRQLVYEWKGQDDAVSFVPGMTLNQFDLISMMHRNFTYTRREGDFSVLHVAFNLKRHTGYFLIQVYVPCILIVVLSWVSFWIHREATSDRVGLCVTSVLTLSTISLDSRTDLPKVKYATALDWFLLMSFLYCIATLLEFAGVHYFTKVGSGEILLSEDEWEDIDDAIVAEDNEDDDDIQLCSAKYSNESISEPAGMPPSLAGSFRKRNVMICPIYNDPTHIFPAPSSHASTMERTTQTEPPIISKAHQMWLCLIGDDKFRKQRERDAATTKGSRYVNSVSLIDRVARVAFPMSFALFNLLYWLAYGMYRKEFSWSAVKG